MKKWIPSYRAQGHEEKVTEGTKSLRLLTDSESWVSQLSYDWDGGDTVKIEEYAVGLTFDQETVKFPSSAEAKAYIVSKMKEQWRIAKEKTPDAAATAQGAGDN